MKTDSLLTDVSSVSILQTCSCSTCTCSNKTQNKIKSDYFECNDDCLTYAFIILYENSIWCMQIIYELLFKSLWQVLMYVKQELQHNRSDNKTISNMDMISINNSASTNYSLMCKKKNNSVELSRYHLSLLEARNRKIYHPVSNEKDSFSTDKHIVIVPVRSSYCQTDILKNDLQTINVDLNEQLTDKFSRRLHEPLILMNREICPRQNQTPVFSTISPSIKKIHSDQVSFHQQQSSNEKKEVSPLYLDNRNNKLSTTSGLLVSDTLNKTSSFLPINPTDKTSFSDNSQACLFDLQQRKLCQKKSKQKRRIIDDNNIPLALATSLHSNVSLYSVDYFLTKYIHQVFTKKLHLR